ncbi:MAG TPA: mannosyltransferase family protein, partial [Tepidisphaeraceae bacterium]|nr:mannosyltransferase family protein [Tepidisphaeraceae bacterium]
MSQASYEMTEPPALLPAQQQKPIDERTTFLTILCIVLVSRLGLWLLVYLGTTFDAAASPGTTAIPGNMFLDRWVQWDARWYARIAEHGYTDADGDASVRHNAGFLPLYPLLVRAVSFVVHDIHVAGLLVANLAFAGAMLLLFALVCRLFPGERGEEIARRTIVLICVWPFSFFFGAMYSESLMLLCAIGAFYCAHRKWWLMAGVCAAAAGATRLVGSATAVSLAFVAFSQPDRSSRFSRLRQGASIPIALMGIGGFMAYLAIRFHDPMAYMTTQLTNEWGSANSWRHVREAILSLKSATFGQLVSGNYSVATNFHLLIAAGALMLCAVSWFKLPSVYALWATLVLIISLSRVTTYGRHVGTVFPIFILAAI